MSLKVNRLKKSFGEREILSNVSFSLKPGGRKVIVGGNGSGKTTLFNILTGLLDPDEGEVRFCDDSLLGLEPHQINRLGVGRTFQDIRLARGLTVLENVLLAFQGQVGESWYESCLFRRKLKDEQLSNREAAFHLLGQCFIDSLAHHLARDISYGEQKLLTLACCMANKPKLLLLDEPVAGISNSFADKIAAVITEVEKIEQSLIVIEHNSAFITSLDCEIIYLNNGEMMDFANYQIFQESEVVKGSLI
ncbi:MAG: ATP-binding cassette domain-containing protein [Verrucomicrobiota bacterium]